MLDFTSITVANILKSHSGVMRVKNIVIHVYVDILDIFNSYTFYVTAAVGPYHKTFKKWPKLNATSTLASQLMYFLWSNDNDFWSIIKYSLSSTILSNKNAFGPDDIKPIFYQVCLIW